MMHLQHIGPRAATTYLKGMTNRVIGTRQYFTISNQNHTTSVGKKVLNSYLNFALFSMATGLVIGAYKPLKECINDPSPRSMKAAPIKICQEASMGIISGGIFGLVSPLLFPFFVVSTVKDIRYFIER